MPHSVRPGMLKLPMRSASISGQPIEWLKSQSSFDPRSGFSATVNRPMEIFDLMTLAAQHGSRLEIEARGVDAEDAAAALHDLIEARFQECQASEPAAEQGETPLAIA